MFRQPHIVLIGAMGAGKTSVGRVLAERLDRPFLDSDEQLERRWGAPGIQIAEDEGIPVLHDREASALIEALQTTEPAVIAAAASVVDRADGRAALRDARCVWLDADLDVRMSRTAPRSHRRPVDRVAQAQLDDDRDARFAGVADLRVAVSHLSVSETVDTMLAGLGPLGPEKEDS